MELSKGRRRLLCTLAERNDLTKLKAQLAKIAAEHASLSSHSPDLIPDSSQATGTVHSNAGDQTLLELARTVKDGAGSTLLHRAAQGAASDVATWLVRDCKVDIAPVNSLHKTPLHDAAASNDTVTILLLANAGAPLDATKFNDWTPLMYACEKGHLEAASILVDRNAELVHERNREGSAPLYLAVRNGNVDLVRKLLNVGAEPNLENRNKRRPVHAAAMGGFLEVLKVLVEHGATLDPTIARDSSGTTLWHEAAAHAQDEFLRELAKIEGLPEPSKLLDNNLRHPLHVASREGNASTVATLLSLSGAEDFINLQDVDGATPLMHACVQGFDGCVKELLRKGADTSCKSSQGGHTALELAQRWKREACVETLLNICN
mmetsp:Transcript_1597/g.3718  ORF Transcript_1597/g.3718 Transcript_1597/m.3718 type:complete len:377 (+) Transcript_1597:26-1156(+)